MSETPKEGLIPEVQQAFTNLGEALIDAKRERDEAISMVKRLLYVAYLGPESQEKYNVLDEAQQFIKDK
jgi:hypothetical protein